MALVEGFIATGLLFQRVWRRPAAILSCLFFVFLLFLDYGWSTKSLGEDFLKNRVGTMLTLMLMLPITRQQPLRTEANERREASISEIGETQR